MGAFPHLPSPSPVGGEIPVGIHPLRWEGLAGGAFPIPFGHGRVSEVCAFGAHFVDHFRLFTGYQPYCVLSFETASHDDQLRRVKFDSA